MSSDHRKNRSETDDSVPESKEMAGLKNHLDAFCSHISLNAIQKFWPDRPQSPELNDNDVTEEELLTRVNADLKEHIIDNLTVIEALVKNSREPEKAFEGVSVMLTSTAQGLAKTHYETLINSKKNGIDPLTGLPNRQVFNHNLKTGLERNARFGESFSFIIFDLDHFKEVNDTYGHDAGDRVLVEMARRLSQDVSLRELDLLVRYGGEEFAIILPATPKEGACILADRISKTIGKEPFKITDGDGRSLDITVTASIGISQYTNTLEDALGTEVQRRADHCLYILKGKRPDVDGVVGDRRGQIACDGRVISEQDVTLYKTKLSGSGRSSFPVHCKDR